MSSDVVVFLIIFFFFFMCVPPPSTFFFSFFLFSSSSVDSNRNIKVDRGAKGEAVAVAIDVIQPFVPFRSFSFLFVKRQEKSILFYCCTRTRTVTRIERREGWAIEGLHHGDIFLFVFYRSNEQRQRRLCSL